MIKLDASTSQTVVVTCTDCPYWAAIRFGMLEGHTCAENHERDVHPEALAARNAGRQYRLRHSGDSSNVTPR